MKRIMSIMSLATCASLAIYSFNASSVTDTAQANAVVTAAISIVQVSDLEFGSAVQGAIAKTVAPGTSEDAENGSFNIAGSPSTAYTIDVVETTITMITGAGVTADEQIVVNAFLSYPAEGANGLLDGAGAQTMFVGGTRAALSATQTVGSYTAAFTVDVIY